MIRFFIACLLGVLLPTQFVSAQLRESPHEGHFDYARAMHVEGPDNQLIDSAFLTGYADNIVYVRDGNIELPTLTIQSTSRNEYRGGGRTEFSSWTRDLYWGFLGWAQAGDPSVLKVMKSSLRILLIAKSKNQAVGQSKGWPLDDKRFYIPQAYVYRPTTGLTPALGFYPWCSESQADFLLLAYDYWQLSGDKPFLDSIWHEITYITKTLELLDTDGNSLPDALWGTYDYQGMGRNTEEPLMSAKTSLAYAEVAKLARLRGEDSYADRLEALSRKVKETMNKDIKDGGLWKGGPSGGYYVDCRKTDKGINGINDKFIPYENLVPMWCGVTRPDQDKAIFKQLDDKFEKYYDLKYGPMYCAPAGHNDQSVMDCSSVPWLAFLDVYLRGKKDHEVNRERIYDLLMAHAHDAGGIPFPEGASIHGALTGGAGRAWDNGNFFHMLVCGIYGLEKNKDGIQLSNPGKISTMPLTSLRNFRWKDAVYDFRWEGSGTRIRKVMIDGRRLKPYHGMYMLKKDSGQHSVVVQL